MKGVKLSEFIREKLHRLTIKYISASDEAVCQVILHMEQGANTWNQAAIEFSEENIKIPSRRKLICYPVLNLREAPEVSAMSTNEWNSLALKQVDAG